ncbi:MAG: tetratricopeptide repeat protein [Candidatus Omnitrophota bacterium]|jgi:tetratricopeptide (TPR) repeat protein
MKRTITVIAAMLACLLAFKPSCEAEKVYYTDGRVADEKIISRSRDTIKLTRTSGEVSVKRDRIDKILNDDGSVSRYDYEGICNAIKDKVKEGKYAEAASFCDTLLQAFPKSSEIHYLRAVLNHKAGDLSKTKEDYNFVLEKGTVDAKILNNLGAIYATDKDNAKAAEMFNKAIEQDPSLAEAHFNLAGMLVMDKDFPGAINEYNKVIEKEPDNVEALYNLGAAYSSRGDNVSAKGCWKKILAVDPQNFEAKAALDAISAGN